MTGRHDDDAAADDDNGAGGLGLFMTLLMNVDYFNNNRDKQSRI